VLVEELERTCGGAGEGERRVSEGGWRGRVAGEGDWPKREWFVGEGSWQEKRAVRAAGEWAGKKSHPKNVSTRTEKVFHTSAGK
jgi:hypothetical protein